MLSLQHYQKIILGPIDHSWGKFLLFQLWSRYSVTSGAVTTDEGYDNTSNHFNISIWFKIYQSLPNLQPVGYSRQLADNVFLPAADWLSR